MTARKNKSLYAHIAVDRYVDKHFDYLVPLDMRKAIKPGMRALIDFKGKKIFGMVIGLASTTDVPGRMIKSVLHIDEDMPFFDEKMLTLARWIAEYYCAPLGMVLKNVIPAEIRKIKNKHFRSEGKGLDDDNDIYLPPVAHTLNSAQSEALDKVKNVMQEGIFKTFLLFGVTGSGKTEVYMRAIEFAKKSGKQTIVIVPEIALTPQMIETFRTRFDDVALFHSQLTPRQRRLYWTGMREGRYNIVIGARSAIFAPFQNLGLIIVDEEHERTFKQNEIPFYNARDVAVMRGKFLSSCVILGSATPSLESFSNAEKGKYDLITLPARVDEKELPGVRVIDMNQEIRRNKGKNPVLSSVLLSEIEKRLLSGEQVILFLNRRGYSTFVCCTQCGWIAQCENCSITLTFHKEDSLLRCHRCDHRMKLQKNCPECGEPGLKSSGIGTEKVERMLRKIFSDAKIGRMDTDVTRKKKSLEDILGNFRRGKIDILIGTQMIAKGLDIPNVTLVGIVAADLALNLPDFRSGEYTFQLITQVAGRSGRGAVQGDVILQTFSPELPVIKFAAGQDYLAFYESEKKFREELQYPPFVRFISVCFRGTDEVELAKFAHKSCRTLKTMLSKKNVVFKGPAPSPIKKLNKFYRWNLVIGTRQVSSVAEILKRFAFQEKTRVQVVVDVDPLSFL